MRGCVLSVGISHFAIPLLVCDFSPNRKIPVWDFVTSSESPGPKRRNNFWICNSPGCPYCVHLEFWNVLLKLGCFADTMVDPNSSVLLPWFLLKIRSVRILAYIQYIACLGKCFQVGCSPACILTYSYTANVCVFVPTPYFCSETESSYHSDCSET